jgi:rsbT co-antagonist protein RsbR
VKPQQLVDECSSALSGISLQKKKLNVKLRCSSAESLLQAVLDNQATIAVLDVTGVLIIDTDVATHLLKTVRAAQMMGAEVIITGFSADAARTLTQLGVDISSVRTSGALKQGVAQALSLIGYRVSKTVEV